MARQCKAAHPADGDSAGCVGDSSADCDWASCADGADRCCKPAESGDGDGDSDAEGDGDDGLLDGLGDGLLGGDERTVGLDLGVWDGARVDAGEGDVVADTDVLGAGLGDSLAESEGRLTAGIG